jgi:hypothetical protein
MTPITDANVKIDLEGLQMVFVDKKNEKCRIGVLRDAPEGHPFRISVFKKDANGALAAEPQILTDDQINSELTIEVTNTSTQGISRRKMRPPINRLAGTVGGNHDSFQWVVDFERELIGKPITVKEEGFLSFLTINNGELLARALSTNQLLTRKGPKGDFELFGTVATRTGIDIVLDQPTSQAVFKNGEDTIFIADRTSNFEILIERVCNKQPGGNDANAFFTAIGDGLSEDERIFFSSTPLDGEDNENDESDEGDGGEVPSTPDASCLQGTGGGGGG